MAADRIEPLVRLGVDPRDEEARHRRHRSRIAAAFDEPLDAADVRLGHLGVALQREDQRDVDALAARDHLLDRRAARAFVAGIFT